jgi:hypothetical protein
LATTLKVRPFSPARADTGVEREELRGLGDGLDLADVLVGDVLHLAGQAHDALGHDSLLAGGWMDGHPPIGA